MDDNQYFEINDMNPQVNDKAMKTASNFFSSPDHVNFAANKPVKTANTRRTKINPK